MTQLYLLDDSYQFTDDDSANLTVEHVSSGNRWTFNQDGTFEAPATSPESTDPADVNGLRFLRADDDPVAVINNTSVGDVVIVEPGNRFDVTETLTPNAGVAIVNFGAYSNDPANRNVTFLKTFDGTLLKYRNNYLFGLTFHGNHPVNGYSGDVLAANPDGHVEGPGIERCLVFGGGRHGIDAGEKTHFSIRDSRIRRHGAWGLNVQRSGTGGGELAHLSIGGSTAIAKNGAGAIRLNDAAGHDCYVNANVESNGGPGVKVVDWDRTLHLAGKYNDNDYSAIEIDVTAAVNVIEISGQLRDNNKAGTSDTGRRLAELRVSGAANGLAPLTLRGASLSAPNGHSDDLVAVTTPDPVTLHATGTDFATDGVASAVAGGGDTALSAIGTTGLAAADVTDCDGVLVKGRQVVDLPTGGARYQGLRSAEPHAPSGSGDVYLDDGTNTADGNPHERLDEPASATWVEL